MPNAHLGGNDFTLFYDYDELREGKLYSLNDDEQIEWFRLRMTMVFLEPLRRVFDRGSAAYREMNSGPHDMDGSPVRTFTLAAFSVLLNGIEALGSFLPRITNVSGPNFSCFKAFVQEYMKDWDTRITGDTLYGTRDMPEILWKHFRNGIAHGFVIEGGGVEGNPSPKWKVHEPERGKLLEINYEKFFADFQSGVMRFFNDIQAPGDKRSQFLQRFRSVYPRKVV